MFEIIQPKGRSSRRVVRSKPALPGELGRAYRYRVPVCVEAKPENGEALSEYAFFPAKDVSTTGFYFVSDKLFPVKSKIEFVISFPRKLSSGMTQLMSGVGKCVRVEELHDGQAIRYGIGVQIVESAELDSRPTKAMSRK